MKTQWAIAIALFIVIVVGAIVLLVMPAPTANAPTNTGTNTPTTTSAASIPDLITVDSPLPQGSVASPLTISGRARGTWYFEASAPVELKDSSGTVIATSHVTAQGDWMTTEFVPFTASLTFPAQTPGSVGTLVLMNDNPSGEPANQKELDIPVTF